MGTTNQGSGLRRRFAGARFSIQRSGARDTVPGSVSPHQFAPSPVEHSPIPIPHSPFHTPALPPSAFRLSSAFTLTELLVVITIIGMLAAISAGYLLKAWNTAKQSRTAAEVTNLASAMEEFRRAYGDYPPSYLDHTDLTARGANGPVFSEGISPLRSERGSVVHPVVWSAAKHFGQHHVYPYLNNSGSNETIGLWDPATNNNVNSITGPSASYAPMSPGEALVFWLTSISKDPAHPLSSRTPTRRSFIDLDNARIIRLNPTPSASNSIPVRPGPWFRFREPRMPGRRGRHRQGASYPKYNPGLYFPKDGNQREYVFSRLAATYCTRCLNKGEYPPPATPNPPVPYLSQSAPWNKDNTSNPPLLQASSTSLDVRTDLSSNILGVANGSSQSFTDFQSLCVNPKSFQIISAGLDNDFGAVNTDIPVKTGGTSPGVVARPPLVSYFPIPG